MPRCLYLSGATIGAWAGVQVWRIGAGAPQNITNTWNWSPAEHQHYEVRAVAGAGGSYWVPVSTHPPAAWPAPAQVVGTQPPGTSPVNRLGQEYLPTGVYIWIPNASIPANIVPGLTTNAVLCAPPLQHPPAQHH
ncbi:MAG: hypothetical protein ACRYG7_06720 [Janthinobacterium lividum]